MSSPAIKKLMGPIFRQNLFSDDPGGFCKFFANLYDTWFYIMKNAIFAFSAQRIKKKII